MTGSFKCDTASTDLNDRLQHGKFRNIITVSKDDKFADFNCADTVYGGSDAACIQAAINSASSNDLILIFSGNYTILTKITQNDKNINIIGIGDVNFYINTPITTGEDGVILAGSYVVTPVLSADAVEYSTTITVVDTQLIQDGDILRITKNVQWCPLDYPNQMTGETYLVSGIDYINNIITLSEPLLRNYSISDTITVLIYRPIKIHIENINFIDSGQTDGRIGLSLHYCIDSTINKCKFSDSGTAAVCLYTCYNTKCVDNSIKNCIREGSGYGIGVFNGSAHTLIERNRIQNCRHNITGNVSDNRGLNRGIIIRDNTLVGATIVGSSVIDSHAVSIDYLVTRNEIHTMLANQCAFLNGALDAEFSYNVVYGGQSAVLRRGRIPNHSQIISNNILHGCCAYIAVTVSDGKRLEIVNNTQDGGPHGVYIPSTGVETYKLLRIHRNRISGVRNQGIFVYIHSADMDINISENVLENIDEGGIYVEGKSTSNGVLSIKNNILHDINLTNNFAYGLGVKTISVTGAVIDGNAITDSANLMDYGIYESTGCDNSIISNNVISGAGSKSIRITGSNTKIFKNIGYVTENTGSATLAATTTSLTVSHGLAATPTNVNITPKGNIGSCWWDTPTATTFIIHCSTAPAADVEVNWMAEV